MAFFDDLSSDLDFLFEDAGQAVTYTPANGDDPLSIIGIMTHGTDLEEDQNWGQSLETTGRIRIKISDVAAPQYNDTILIDSETWTVRRKIAKYGGVWELEISKDIRPVFNRG